MSAWRLTPSYHLDVTTPVASVIVPAHNEARVIEGCLKSLLAGAAPDELEIVVACNGCTDGTEEIAAAVSPEVRVVVAEEASKWGAMNLGDEVATAYPRMYLDADVILSERAVQDLAAEMAKTGALVGAPTIRLSTKGQSWAVRNWYDAYQQSGYFAPPFVGLGFYGISEVGRKRFGPFPASGADDLLIKETFAPHERVVSDGWFEPALPKTFKDLYNIRVRQLTANKLRSEAAAGSGLTAGQLERDPRWLLQMLTKPKTAPKGLLYLVMRVVSEGHAMVRSRSKSDFVWSRDTSSH